MERKEIAGGFVKLKSAQKRAYDGIHRSLTQILFDIQQQQQNGIQTGEKLATILLLYRLLAFPCDSHSQMPRKLIVKHPSRSELLKLMKISKIITLRSRNILKSWIRYSSRD